METDYNYIIDEMTLEDVEAVAAIEQASFSDPWPTRSFQIELATNKLAVYLVARKSGWVVAYIGAWIIFEEAHITTLAVEQSCRRQGLATRLVSALIEKAQLRGADLITLEVRPSNTAARAFYEKLGFTALGRRKRYYHNNEDAIICTLRTNLLTF